MAKLSQTTKEIINTSIFLLVVALLVITYIVYPLIKTKDINARIDVEEINPDSLSINDATSFIDKFNNIDTFRVESDGLTNLAGLYIPHDSSCHEKEKGTIFILHKDNQTRDSILSLAQLFYDSGYIVITYDQRASGLSSGKYRGEGKFEADDLNAIISYLNLREKIYYPLTIIGHELGADAAILASLDNPHIQKVIAINPYLTTLRMQNILKEKYDLYWFPFFRTIMWFWYEIRSGYSVEYREIEKIRPVPCSTLLLIDKVNADDEEVTELKSISESKFLLVKPISDDSNLHDEIMNFIF
ncbi:MAG: alpha/beta hydrolase [candidate division Zixibacteria bacterium]|nr:alpha/beta hydrolase [candidate division Zixibacteria bacterium]